MATPEQYQVRFSELGDYLVSKGYLSGDPASPPEVPMAELSYIPPTGAMAYYRANADPVRRDEAELILIDWDWEPKRRRTIYAIYGDVNALTGVQKTAIWTDLNGGTPPKWSTSVGGNSGAMATLQWCAIHSGATNTALLDARMRLIACYVQDVPDYLMNPPFDSTISIPGNEPDV